WYVLDLPHVNPTDFTAYLHLILLTKANKCSVLYKASALLDDYILQMRRIILIMRTVGQAKRPRVPVSLKRIIL
nr:hypothetical protein [Bacillota bacterium]